MTNNQLHLGDGVFAEIAHEGYHLKLTTNTGDPSNPDNEIYLDHHVRKALLEYIAKEFEEILT